MRDKRIKVIYFSLQGSDGREFILSWKTIIISLFSIFSVLLFLVGMSIGVFTDFYHNFRIENLSATNATLRTQLHELGLISGTLQKRMQVLEKENDDLGIFADHPRLDEDTRQVGVGGRDISLADNTLLPHDLQYETNEIRTTIETTLRKTELYEAERDELLSVVERRQIDFDHYPSISPVLGRISDSFGYRIDPFTRKKKHHKGLDIAQRRGTEIKAPADGVVILAKTWFKKNQGFGRVIKIDHGNGIITLYGHLENVMVKEGQKVKRYDVIGTVGSTGRSTGPHLHYEVLRDGIRVNPANYVIGE